jgi:hypothetical protein
MFFLAEKVTLNVTFLRDLVYAPPPAGTAPHRHPLAACKVAGKLSNFQNFANSAAFVEIDDPARLETVLRHYTVGGHAKDSVAGRTN